MTSQVDEADTDVVVHIAADTDLAEVGGLVLGGYVREEWKDLHVHQTREDIWVPSQSN